MLNESARGVYIISVTPFDERGALDLEGTDRLIDFYAKAGADGLTILGMMGEAPKLADQEAVAYLAHPVLGCRLRECTALVNAVEGQTILDILGSPDDLKFRSSMTLFHAGGSDPEFSAALSKFFDGKPDPRTLELLAR